MDATILHLIFPAEKLRKIQQLAQHLLYKQNVSVRDLARFVGKTSASQKAIWQAPLHYRAIQFLINSVMPMDQLPQDGPETKFNAILKLTKEAENNLTWWSSLDRKIPLQSPLTPRILIMTIESDASNMGWGARQGEQQTGGEMVQRGSPTPYKLSGIVGSLLGSTMFCQTQPECDHSDETGQCYSSDIHKQVGGNTLTPTLSACSNHMGLEHTEKHLPSGGTSAREGQSSGGSGIKINERSLRLDAESSGVQPNPAPDGATRDRLVCFPVNKATTTILQLETRPRGSRDRCVQSGLVKDERICQIPVVLDGTLSESSKETSSQNSDDHSIVDIPTMVSIHPGDVGGFSKVITRERRLSDSPVRARIHNESGGAKISSMAHIRESFTSRGISTEATDLLLSSWRPKTKSNYNLLFVKWSCWCTERNRDPTMGPVEDIINFLAQLFKEGYQYRSLNSYRSAISAVHSKVDGQSVGQHPLVTRMLKGVYNERPPLAR